MSESLSNRPDAKQTEAPAELTVDVSPEAVLAELEKIDVTGGSYHPPHLERLKEIQANVANLPGSQFPIQSIEVTMYGLELAEISDTKYGWLKRHQQLTGQYQRANSAERRAKISQQIDRLERDRLLVTVVDDVMYDRVTRAYIATAGYSADLHQELRKITSNFNPDSTPLLKEFDIMHERGFVGFSTHLQCEMNARALIAAQMGLQIPKAESGLKSVE